MDYEKLAAMAEQAGFTAWSPLDVSTLEVKPEVRAMCADNTCGAYEKRWSCPPGCGSLEACAEKLKKYTHGILVQTCGDVEDSLDFEAMMEIEADHKARFARMFDALRAAGVRTLALGAGCCTQCPQCTYPDAPCRFPDRRVCSMEAYGMLVLEVCRANGLTYYYGPDHMAYTSCFLLK